MTNQPKPEQPSLDAERREQAYNKYWAELTRQGDPMHIPNKFKKSFDAGWQARAEQPAAPSHLQHVQRFLLEMYQTMVDPVEEFHGNIEELCALLLRRAREDREALHVAKEDTCGSNSSAGSAEDALTFTTTSGVGAGMASQHISANTPVGTAVESSGSRAESRSEAAPLEQRAREWLHKECPPLKCIHCGQAVSFAPMASGNAFFCKKSTIGHVYEFTNDPDAEVKRLVKFGSECAQRGLQEGMAQERKRIELLVESKVFEIGKPVTPNSKIRRSAVVEAIRATEEGK